VDNLFFGIGREAVKVYRNKSGGDSKAGNGPVPIMSQGQANKKSKKPCC
jgi:hypothetical protein